MSKVLIVDKTIDRKKRIAALKARGFSVFPALQLAEARSRCKPDVYDLVIVNAQDELEMAVSFCDELSARTPAQIVLLVVAEGAGPSGRLYAVQDDPEILAERAANLLGSPSKERAEGEEASRASTPARASA